MQIYALTGLICKVTVLILTGVVCLGKVSGMLCHFLKPPQSYRTLVL